MLVRAGLAASRGATIVLFALVVAAALLRNAFVLAGGFLVGSIPHVVEHGVRQSGGVTFLVALVSLVTLGFAQSVVSSARTSVSWTVGKRIEIWLREGALGAALTPSGVEHVTDPANASALELARDVDVGVRQPAAGVQPLVAALSLHLTGLGAALLLAHEVALWAPVPIVAAWIAMALATKRQFKALSSPPQERPLLRRSLYLRDLVFRPDAAKEIRVFGLREWLLDRVSAHWLEGMAEVWAIRRRLGRELAVASLLLLVAYGGVLVVIARAGVSGRLDLTSVAVAVQAALATYTIYPVVQLLLVRENAGAIPRIVRLRNEIGKERVRVSSAGVSAERRPEGSIAFSSISFRYPRDERPVLSEVDLTVRAGTSVAIVGANGAGKTTLIKLLAALYRPDGGEIRVDGVRLEEYDLASWRRQLAVVFQDFGRYPFSMCENVALGDLGRDVDRAALERAARIAELADVVRRLPRGWSTPLSRALDGGVDLSGGEWQRVALARALYAVETGARVLVLDEPSAHLDPRAEAALFDRLVTLAHGTTTILISHRFATVRRAEEIVVLDGGRAVERGSHTALLARRGLYARMFELQAKTLA